MRKFKNKNIIQSFVKAYDGIVYIYRTHEHFKIELLFALIAVLLGIIFKINIIEWVFIFNAIFFFFISEIFNTVVELIGDSISEEYNEKIKIFKDLSGGAVLFAVIYSLIIAGIIFLPKILK